MEREYGLRRLLLSLGGRRRAHDEVSKEVFLLSTRETSRLDDGIRAWRYGDPGGEWVRQANPLFLKSLYDTFGYEPHRIDGNWKS